jgi:hypothetical protein
VVGKLSRNIAWWVCDKKKNIFMALKRQRNAKKLQDKLGLSKRKEIAMQS